MFGATGGIGSHIVSQLRSRGHTVTAYLRNPGKVPGRPRLPARVALRNWARYDKMSAERSGDPAQATPLTPGIVDV